MSMKAYNTSEKTVRNRYTGVYARESTGPPHTRQHCADHDSVNRKVKESSEHGEDGLGNPEGGRRDREASREVDKRTDRGRGL